MTTTAAQKKPPVKAAPKTETTALKTRVEQLETELAELKNQLPQTFRWCLHEEVYNSKVAAIRAALADPKIQEQLAAQLTNQLPT